MNIEQKLEYLRQMIEKGAYVDIKFHNFRDQKEAEKIATECSTLLNQSIEHLSSGSTHWFEIDQDSAFRTVVFFENKEEEVSA